MVAIFPLPVEIDLGAEKEKKIPMEVLDFDTQEMLNLRQNGEERRE